jgi:hypothetical protein
MNKDLLIAIDDAHLSQMGDVVERLREAGVDVRSADRTLGTVTGSIDPSHVGLDALQALDGVDVVEEQATYELPPPDAPVQ